MLSCEICFELTASEYRRRSTEIEYLAPAALLRYGPQVERAAADFRDGLKSVKTVPISSDKVSRESVFQLLVRLGSAWRCSALLWRFGGQFQSYETDRFDGPLTFVHLNWEPFTPESYGGTLLLTQYGPNQDFLAAILEECAQLPAFKDIKVPRIPRERARKELLEGPESHLALEQVERNIQAFVPISPIANADFEIGFSFAGDPNLAEPVEEWCLLRDDSIEKWPRALAKLLRDRYFQVEDYRREQDRKFYDRTPPRKEYLLKVASRDFCVVFTSREYFRSPYCMFEFLKIYQRMPNGGHNPAILRIGALPGGRFSETSEDSSSHTTKQDSSKEFWKYWKEKLDEFNKNVSEDPQAKNAQDFAAFERIRNQYSYKEWMDCVDSDQRLDLIVSAIRSGFTLESLTVCPQEDELASWVEHIEANLKRQEIWLEIARYAWVNGNGYDQKRAKRIFRHALITQNGNASREQLLEILKKQMMDETLNDIRVHVLDEILK